MDNQTFSQIDTAALIIVCLICSSVRAQVIYFNTADSIYKLIVTPSGCIIKPSAYSCPVAADPYWTLALYKDTMYIGDYRNLYYTTLSNPGVCTELLPGLGGNSLVADSNGILYSDGGNTFINRFDPHTNKLTQIDSFQYVSSGDLTFYNGKLYMAADSVTTAGPDLLVEMNLDSPQLSKPVYTFTDGSAFALASSEGKCGSGQLFAIVETNKGTILESIDPANGTKKNVCPLPGGFEEVLDAASPAEGENFTPVDIENINTAPICTGATVVSQVSISAYSSNGQTLNYLLNNGDQNNTGVFDGLPLGNYTVHISAGDSCFADTSFTIVKSYCNKLAVPTAFTPNNDGLNDILRPVGILPAGGVYFAVFNRWGQKIFETHDTSIGWDGTFKGLQQPTGTYVWLMQYKDANGKPISERGTSVLIR